MIVLLVCVDVAFDCLLETRVFVIAGLSVDAVGVVTLLEYLFESALYGTDVPSLYILFAFVTKTLLRVIRSMRHMSR